jgi:hypothetical protein
MTRGHRKGRADLPADPAGILRRTDRTLGETLESILGTLPELHVIALARTGPPIPAWLSPPLSRDGQTLARWTSYQVGDVVLSRNIAHVDLGRMDPELAGRLERQEVHLGQVMLDERIEKFGFEFGTEADAGEIGMELKRGFPSVLSDMPQYVWRRYAAGVGGRAALVVVESLPTATWDRLLASEPERARLREKA